MIFSVEAKNNQIEIAHIDVKLKELSDRKAELQKTYDAGLSGKEDRSSVRRDLSALL